MSSGAPDWWIQGIIPMLFLNLGDTPGDYEDRAGLILKVNADEDALEFSDSEIDDHAADHEEGGSQEITHNSLDLGVSDHHTKFTALEARQAINSIFGADGKADKLIDLDTFALHSGRTRFGLQVVNTDGQITQNAYYDAPNWKYIANGYAMMLTMEDDTGNIILKTAPSGLADGVITFTARFTLDVSGNLISIANIKGIDLKAPVSINHSAFVPKYSSYNYSRTFDQLANRTVTSNQSFFAHVQLPHGLTVNRVDLYGYRNDVLSVLHLWMYRNDRAGGEDLMADITADWADGYGSKEDASIDDGLIDNDTYTYLFQLSIDPNNDVGDCAFSGAKISFA